MPKNVPIMIVMLSCLKIPVEEAQKNGVLSMKYDFKLDNLTM
jgi:hypothetical protein